MKFNRPAGEMMKLRHVRDKFYGSYGALIVAAIAMAAFSAPTIKSPHRDIREPQQTHRGATPAPSAEIEFNYGGNVAQVPAQISDALPLIPVSVNGTEPSWFLLDTARPESAIDDVRAVAVGLYTPSAEGKLPRAFLHVTLEFPGLRISVPSLALGSFGDLSARIGHAVQGVLGADVLSQLILKINYDRQYVQFYDPKSFRYSGKGLKYPMKISGSVPAIQGKIAIHHRGNFRGAFAIATGQTEPLRFLEHFAGANSLANPPERTLPFSAAGAANDTDVRDRIGRVHEIQLGKIRFLDPLAIFPGKSAKNSDALSRQFIGAMGGEILDRFNVILDYPARLVILEANKHFPDLFTADMSGLTIIAIPPSFNKFEISSVGEKSPAAEAGVMAGDMIEQADGNPASEYTLDDLRAMMREPGTSHTLTLLRNGKTIHVTLNLKPLI